MANLGPVWIGLNLIIKMAFKTKIFLKSGSKMLRTIVEVQILMLYHGVGLLRKMVLVWTLDIAMCLLAEVFFNLSSSSIDFKQ